jgi:hypothetical protein
MFRVEIEFKPDLDDIARYTSACDEIFADLNMPCIDKSHISRVYGDNGNPKDIGILYRGVGKISRTPWIVQGIYDAHFDNGHNRDTLMTNFFEAASQ